MYNHLKVPESWNSYFSKYPQGLTIMEALLDWVGQVDNMIDHINTTDDHIKHLEQNLEEFYLRFDSELTEQIQNTLQTWIEDGTLEQVISQLIENRMTYPTIQALQQAPNIFKNGTVVELLGYYTAGDGGGQKVVIKSERTPISYPVGNKFACFIGHEITTKQLGIIDNTTDATDKIQNALSQVDVVVLVSDIKTTKPLVLEGGKVLKSEIRKRYKIQFYPQSGLVKDVTPNTILEMNVEQLKTISACIVIPGGAQHTHIENIEIYNHVNNSYPSTEVRYGLLICHGVHINIINMYIGRFETGIECFKGWNNRIEDCRIVGNINGLVIGDAFETENTSWVISKTFVDYSKRAYVLRGVTYSNIQSIACDHCVEIAYSFTYCYLSINGFGCEQSTGKVIYSKDSNISIVGGHILNITESSEVFAPATTNALVEIANPNRESCGLILESFDWREQTLTSAKLFEMSKRARLYIRNSRFWGFWDGTALRTVINRGESTVLEISDSLEPVRIHEKDANAYVNGYKNASSYAGDNMFIYNDTGNPTSITEIRIPLSELKRTFPSIGNTDNYSKLVYRITLNSGSSKSWDIFWRTSYLMNDHVKTMGTAPTISSIVLDSTDFVITLSTASARNTVIIQVA